MNIILFGPPGAGKGTQSKYLVNKLNGFQISTGDLLREEITKNSDIGKVIIDDMKDGNFISDDIVNKLIENLVSDPLKKNKLIFDGYPIIKRLEKRKILENRSDDETETILRRYEKYMEKTQPVLNFYSQNPNFKEIDGNLEIDEITRKIDTFINV